MNISILQNIAWSLFKISKEKISLKNLSLIIDDSYLFSFLCLDFHYLRQSKSDRSLIINQNFNLTSKHLFSIEFTSTEIYEEFHNQVIGLFNIKWYNNNETVICIEHIKAVWQLLIKKNTVLKNNLVNVTVSKIFNNTRIIVYCYLLKLNIK